MTETPGRHGLTIRAARVVPATPSAVFRVLTDPAAMPRWWGKTEKGVLFVCETDGRAGGRYRWGMRIENGAEDIVSGAFVEFAPPTKLAFTWSSESGADGVVDSHVSIELLDLKDGSTRVVVTHQGLPTPSSANAHSAGWHDMMQDMSLHFVAV